MLSPRTQGSPGAQFDRKEPLCALVGSGISICAGMPGVCAMTDRIESDTEIYRHGGIYYLGREIDSNNQRSQQKLCKARELFRSVKLHLRDYFEKNMDRQPNYEDVYYLVEQMYDELLKELGIHEPQVGSGWATRAR